VRNHRPRFGIPILNISTAKAIDRYVQARSDEQSGSKEKIDSRLQTTIEGIFNRCIAEGEFKQVCCICI